MEDPQHRRRRPVTYGKPTRKRLSTDFNDIFSSPSSRSPSVDAKEKGGASWALPTPVPTSNPLRKSLQDKLPQVTKGLAPAAKNAKPTAIPAIPAATRKLRPADISSDEDASRSPTDVAAAAQLQFEERASNHNDPSIFDIPCSDDDESAPLKRKRAPPKASSKTNNKTAKASTTATSMAAPSKRPRASTKPPAEPKSSKSIITGKITKLTKGKEQAATQTLVVEKRSSGKGDTALPQRRMTRSQSVEPTTIKHTTIPKDTEFPTPRSGNIEVVIPTTENHPTSKPPTQERKIDKPPPKKPARRSLEKITEEKSPTKIPVEKAKAAERPRTELPAKTQPRKRSIDALSAETGRPSKRKSTSPNAEENSAATSLFAEELPAKTRPRKRSSDGISAGTGRPSKRRSTSPKETSLFAEELPPKAKPRKRLIDALGANTGRPSKRRSTSPKTDTSNPEIFFGFGSEDQPPEPPQSQVISESQESSSQEIKITIQRQFGNGMGGSRVTYARQRSYRAEEVTEDNFDDFLLNMPPLPAIKPMNSRRRLEHPRPKEDDEETKPRTTIKSIHELRAAGEHHRFIDDVEDLLLDVEGNAPIGTKRSG
jgi:hypothetical protein